MKRITAATASFLGAPRFAPKWQQAAVVLPAGRLALRGLTSQLRDSPTFSRSVGKYQ